jgi:hypothetical protein
LALLLRNILFHENTHLLALFPCVADIFFTASASIALSAAEEGEIEAELMGAEHLNRLSTRLVQARFLLPAFESRRAELLPKDFVSCYCFCVSFSFRLGGTTVGLHVWAFAGVVV